MFVLEIYIMLSSSYSQSMSLSFLILKVTETKIEKKKRKMLPSQHNPFEVGSHMQDILRDDNLPFSHTMQGFDSDIFVVISKLQA